MLYLALNYEHSISTGVQCLRIDMIDQTTFSSLNPRPE